jgi:hypothetical protein
VGLPAEWIAARKRKRYANVVATASAISPALALLCFISYRVFASSGWAGGWQGSFAGGLANAGWALCIAALVLGVASLLIGTERRARALVGVLGSVPASLLGLVLIMPVAL